MFAQHAVVDQLLVQHAGVGQHPHCHGRLDGGLELQQHQEVQPFIVEPDPPHQIAVALAQAVADEAGRHRGEGREIERLAPVAGGEAAQQVLNRVRLREQPLVAGIVHGEATIIPHPLIFQAMMGIALVVRGRHVAA